MPAQPLGLVSCSRADVERQLTESLPFMSVAVEATPLLDLVSNRVDMMQPAMAFFFHSSEERFGMIWSTWKIFVRAPCGIASGVQQ